MPKLKSCKIRDTLDFKLECAKIFLKKNESFSESFIIKSQISSKNLKLLQNFLPEKATEICPPSKHERLRNMLQGMSMVVDPRKSNIGGPSWFWLHIWFIMTLY